GSRCRSHGRLVPERIRTAPTPPPAATPRQLSSPSRRYIDARPATPAAPQTRWTNLPVLPSCSLRGVVSGPVELEVSALQLIHRRIIGSPGPEPVDTAIKHAECSCDEYGMMNLLVDGSGRPRSIHVLLRHQTTALLHLAGDGKQRAQLLADLGALQIHLHSIDHLGILT